MAQRLVPGQASLRAAAPKVTVLMTVYNGRRFLGEAIHSVLDQSFRDFELLVVDDASTDDSRDLVAGFADARIRLERNAENHGQAWCLNRGLELARSAYIARLDQDDVCDSDRLRQQVEWLDTHPAAAAVGTWMCTITAAGRRTGVVGLRIPDFGGLLGALLSGECPVGHPTVMYRRDVVLSAGSYNPDFAPGEDYELWTRLARRRCEINVLPRPLVRLRIHPGQQTATKSHKQHEKMRIAHRRLLAGWGDQPTVDAVGGLLQPGDDFWTERRTDAAVEEATAALDRVLATVRESLNLTKVEARSLERAVCWWLGRRAFTAILAQHRQSRVVYRRALRPGWRIMWHDGAVLAYPLCFRISPWLGPRVGKRCLGWARRISRSRHRIKLLWK